MRLDPLDRQLEVRIREAGPRFPGARAFPVFVVRLPGDVDDVIDVGGDRVEGGIGEALAQPTLEFLARQLDVSLPLAHVDGHGFRLLVLRERVVRIAVEPPLASFGGGDHRMTADLRVPGGVTVR